MATSFEAGISPQFTPLFAEARAVQAGPAWLSALSARGGFAPDLPFVTPSVAPVEGEREANEALACAHAAGLAEGRLLAEAEFAIAAEARAALGASLTRLDEAMQQQLALRLAETVAALCEAALAPLAIDPEALQRRCINAAGMVGDGIIDASLRLHPDDIALLDPGFASTWHLVPDVALERGSVVLDMAEGAVVDGPGEWLGALREALGLC